GCRGATPARLRRVPGCDRTARRIPRRGRAAAGSRTRTHREDTIVIIDRAEGIVTSPDRNFVTLKLTTDDGLTGLGDATPNGPALAVAAYLAHHLVPLPIGRDAHRIEDAWQFLYRSAYWRRGPVTMTAIAAVDMALWDLKGKAAGLP